MTLTVETEPACPDLGAPDAGLGTVRIEARPLRDIPRQTWDRLAAANPAATPFSNWAFHRAWWDAYGDNAHEQTLVAVAANGPRGSTADPLAIIPLMHRHEVEPGDEAAHTTLRHEHGDPLTPVAPTATAIFFGACYHADYATILGDPVCFPAVAEALADHLAGDGVESWDVIDLRRLRDDDPAASALAAAFSRRERSDDWTLTVEREDVCPVATLPAGGSIDDYLATLGRRERHEIRRKVRRAEAAGPVELRESKDPVNELEAFIDLHQRRWGADGLFPDTAGGGQSRTLFRRLFELFGPGGAARLSFLEVGGRPIAAGVTFQTADELLYYNAGIDPDARDLSPGVLLVERYVQRALELGLTRLDFLRGNEDYKYDWGAVDEPIQRILVRRAAAGSVTGAVTGSAFDAAEVAA